MKIILILILLILIIYIINRLKIIVEPFEDSVVRTNLVFTSAGDNTNFYDYWFDNNRNYDVFCVYYGNNNNNYLIYSNIVDKIWNRKGSKFQNFNYIYTNFANLFDKYERFFIMDDDIIISTDNINKMFDISKEYNLWICQPSFTYESKISHHITKHNTDNILRYTNFIEVNSPLFSKYALDIFMLYYDPILVEWGVDYLYIWALGNNIKNKYAIIDSILCTNPCDIDKKNKNREFNNVSNSQNQILLWYIIKNKYNIANITTKVYNIIKKDKLKLSSKLSNSDLININMSHIKMLNMMKIFHSICKNNDINYFLIAESLLGCIKYDGWIPWGSNINIMIDTNNIKKLKEICTETNNILIKYNLWFQDSTTDINYKLPWSKIRDNTLCYVNDIDYYSHHNGLILDIFEYKNVNNNDVILLNYDEKNVIFNITDIVPLKIHVFEDTMFYIPNNYTKFLIHDYGIDWNIIPDIEKRIPLENNYLMKPNNKCDFPELVYN